MKIIHNNMLKDLLQGCIDGKRLSQKKLYERYYGKMMGVCMRYTSCRDEAAGILNTGFLKVFQTLPKFDIDKGNFEGWMYRIMVNTSIDHYRKEAKHKHTAEIDQGRTKADNYDVVSEMSANEILGLVQQLTPGYRTIFNLYVVEGFNHREIGEKLGISEGTSKSNLSKARQKLQEMIKTQTDIKHRAYAK